jgi:hypothetical protein
MRQNVADKLRSRTLLRKLSKPSLRKDTMTLISAAASIFPYDPKIDSVMDHQHLVIAYCLTWFVHLCYLGYVSRKWYAAKNQKP